MPTEVTNSKYRLRKMGGSRVVILFCHGAWSTNDGKIFVPNGMAIHFYSAHGQYGTKGAPLFNNLTGLASADNPIPQSILQSIMTRRVNENWSNERLDQEILVAKAEANAQGAGESMDIVESVQGKRFGSRQKVYNYELSYTGPEPNDQRAENFWRSHQRSRAAVDLLIMQPGAEGHLESAIRFARSKGEKYTVFHFLPCRWIDQNDRKSMRTAGLPATRPGDGTDNIRDW